MECAVYDRHTIHVGIGLELTIVKKPVEPGITGAAGYSVGEKFSCAREFVARDLTSITRLNAWRPLKDHSRPYFGSR
jgi:hypothetical protein